MKVAVPVFCNPQPNCTNLMREQLSKGLGMMAQHTWQFYDGLRGRLANKDYT